MKKLFFAAVVLALAFASCTNKENYFDEENLGDYDVATVSIDALGSLNTRALTGGIAVPAGHKLRYLVQITSSGANFGPPQIFNDNSGDDGTVTNASIRVPRGVDFEISAWADIVPNASLLVDNLYNTSAFPTITLASGYANTYAVPIFAQMNTTGGSLITDISGNHHNNAYSDPTTPNVAQDVLDMRDAFYRQPITIPAADFVNGSMTTAEADGSGMTGVRTITLKLKRPFARINLISLDAVYYEGVSTARSQLPVQSILTFNESGNDSFSASFGIDDGKIPALATYPVDKETTANLNFGTTSYATIAPREMVAVEYLFADAAKGGGNPANENQLADFTVKFMATGFTDPYYVDLNGNGTYDGGEEIAPVVLTNIPYAQNWITNIYFYPFTDNATVTIEVINEFHDTIYHVTTGGDDDSSNKNGVADPL